MSSNALGQCILCLFCPKGSPVLHTGFVSKVRRQIRAVGLPIPSSAAMWLCGGRDPCNKHMSNLQPQTTVKQQFVSYELVKEPCRYSDLLCEI